MTLLSVFYSLERLRGKKVHYNFKIHGFLIALEWSDIDLIGKQIAVIKSAERINSNAFTVTAHTKNGKDRYLNSKSANCQVN